MRNLYLFVGPSGVGKTTLVNELCKRYGYKQVISCTDRPKRHPGEDSYIFLTEEEFTAQSGMIATTEYDGHRYGVLPEVLEEADLYIMDIPGVEYMKQSYKGRKSIRVIGLEQHGVVLIQRMEKRGDSPEDALRRYERDRVAFKDLEKVADVIFCSVGREATVKAINAFIRDQEYSHSITE